jgi:hypothetical protein
VQQLSDATEDLKAVFGALASLLSLLSLHSVRPCSNRELRGVLWVGGRARLGV